MNSGIKLNNVKSRLCSGGREGNGGIKIKITKFLVIYYMQGVFELYELVYYI